MGHSILSLQIPLHPSIHSSMHPFLIILPRLPPFSQLFSPSIFSLSVYIIHDIHYLVHRFLVEERRSRAGPYPGVYKLGCPCRDVHLQSQIPESPAHTVTSYTNERTCLFFFSSFPHHPPFCKPVVRQAKQKGRKRSVYDSQ